MSVSDPWHVNVQVSEGNVSSVDESIAFVTCFSSSVREIWPRDGEQKKTETNRFIHVSEIWRKIQHTMTFEHRKTRDPEWATAWRTCRVLSTLIREKLYEAQSVKSAVPSSCHYTGIVVFTYEASCSLSRAWKGKSQLEVPVWQSQAQKNPFIVQDQHYLRASAGLWKSFSDLNPLWIWRGSAVTGKG